MMKGATSMDWLLPWTKKVLEPITKEAFPGKDPEAVVAILIVPIGSSEAKSIRAVEPPAQPKSLIPSILALTMPLGTVLSRVRYKSDILMVLFLELLLLI